MSRVLVALLLFHHIEGVCRPFSPASGVISGYVAGFLGRDREQAAQRAQEGRAARLARGREAAARRQRRAAPVITVEATAGTDTPPGQLPRAVPATSWQEQARSRGAVGNERNR